MGLDTDGVVEGVGLGDGLWVAEGDGLGTGACVGALVGVCVAGGGVGAGVITGVGGPWFCPGAGPGETCFPPLANW
jgi:hypothetical protein